MVTKDTNRRNGSATINRRDAIRKFGIVSLGATGVVPFSGVGSANNYYPCDTADPECGGGSSGLIPLNYSSTDDNDSYGADTSISASHTSGLIRGYLATGLYGEGFINGQLWGHYTPDESGSHEVEVNYNRTVHVNNAELVVSVFVRRNRSINDKPVETLISGRDALYSGYRSFNLNSGVRYDVGVEILGHSGSAGSEGGVVDMQYNNREVVVSSVVITPP